MGIFSSDSVQITSEIGINHDGSLEKALDMIRISADCGADFCKFQLLKAEEMYQRDAGSYKTEVGSTDDIYNLVKKHELQQEWIPRLIEECKENGVRFLTTVCDLVGLEEILEFEPEILKVASYEIHYHYLFEKLGEFGIPLIFSTAGATIGDVDEALKAYGDSSNTCIMQCNGKYPADRDMVNMNVLRTFRHAFPEASIGFSDHTKDPIEAPVAATALGAQMIEKHFTLDKTSPGPDHGFAIEPKGLEALVEAVREAEEKRADGEEFDIDPVVLGTSRKDTHEKEKDLRDYAYRSLYADADIGKGETLTEENVAVYRAGELPKGMHPRHLGSLIGQSAPHEIEQGTPLTLGTLLGGSEAG